jgi:hypothetical protein
VKHPRDPRCQAMVLVAGVWTRCWDMPTEDHHMLTRARGGRILDDVGETYHHIFLCRRHHANADGAEAYEGGLLIDGYVTRENGRVVYYGTDEYLKEKYRG